jgi:MFS family permease
MTEAISPAADAEALRKAKANVLRLAAAGAFAGGNSTVIVATSSIAGSMFASDPAYATVPVSIFVVGSAMATLPQGWVAREYGRRAAFMIGTGCGILTGLVGSLAMFWGSFVLLCVATFLGGIYAAVAASYRFAATDGAPGPFRPKAISWVMTGGVFAGILGPQMVQWTMNIWPPYLFSASYLAQAFIAFCAMVVLWSVDLPKPAAADLKAGRPLMEIVSKPAFVTAALCGVVAYGLMNLVMTSAPLAMKMCGLTLEDSNLGIQWHVLAMFAPSFFTGSLIARFGAKQIVAVGMVLLALSAVAGLAGLTVWHFWIGLVLLGVGWNFGFVGASAMVVETHRQEERHKVQAFNDFVVFGIMAAGSFSSGHLLTAAGWDAVNHVVFPPVVVALAALYWGWRRDRRAVEARVA